MLTEKVGYGDQNERGAQDHQTCSTYFIFTTKSFLIYKICFVLFLGFKN